MTTFHVHVLGTDGLGEHIRSFDRYSAATRFAAAWPVTTVIVDEARGLVRWGDEWTTTRDHSTTVPAPDYATRAYRRADRFGGH